MNEDGVARGGARRQHESDEHRRQRGDEPRTPSQVADHAVPVRNPEVVERERRDHVDGHAARADVLDGVGDEPPGHVLGRARVGRGQDDDLHRGERRTSRSVKPRL
jgi:hypothetical protein